jgi:hypothetical protein
MSRVASINSGEVIAMSAVENIPELVRRLYDLVGELEQHFPGRPFTPDGHLVGSLGEVLAAHHYGLDLLPCSAKLHDAVAGDGRLVQIKATQGQRIGLRGEPEHLIVLQITPEGSARELYNGPGAPVWGAAGAMQDNGQRPISASRLRGIMEQVSADMRLPVVKEGVYVQ